MGRISIVIPLYNEEHRIKYTKSAILEFFEQYDPRQVEIILVNDASTDRTLELLRQWVHELREIPVACRLISLPTNSGKGAALKAGVTQSSGQWILTLDADMAVKPIQLLYWARTQKVDLEGGYHLRTIYIGSREEEESQVKDGSMRRFMGRLFNLTIQVVCNIFVNDTQCGFKLYPGEVGRHLFGRLKTMGWAHDVEILLRAQQDGVSIQPLPVEWTAMPASKVNVLRDGITMLIDIIKIRLLLRG